MSWLFKDAMVTVTWLNFYHTRPNIKDSNWKDQRDQIAPNEFFFSKKQLIKFSCTSWSLLLSKIKNKTWEQIQSEEDTIPFLFENSQMAPNKISFRKTINIIFMSLLALFIVQNNPYSWSRVLRQDVTFWILNDPFAQNNNFFG